MPKLIDGLRHILLFEADELVEPTIQYRCTFPDRYPEGSSPREHNGHYVTAFSPEDAVLRLRKREGYNTGPITVELWR